MLKCAVKFCGGCNPGYDRGAAYRGIREELRDVASFDTPKDGEAYDALLIIRGCTACPYLYEEIPASERVICTREADIPSALTRIRSYAEQAAKADV